MSRDIISEGVLIQLTELNHEFLAVLRAHAEQAQPAQRVLGIRQGVAGQLVGLSDEALRRLAACPYALFDLRLGDSRFWRAVRAQHLPDTYAKPAIPEALVGVTHSFVHAALMYAWYLARTRPLAARLTMGMSQQSVDTFAVKSIVSFAHVTRQAPGLLAATHYDNKVFWPDLIHYAANGTRQQFEAAVGLGTQLLPAC